MTARIPMLMATVLLSTTAIAAAQQAGTTIVPAGQTAPDAMPQAGGSASNVGNSAANSSSANSQSASEQASSEQASSDQASSDRASSASGSAGSRSGSDESGSTEVAQASGKANGQANAQESGQASSSGSQQAESAAAGSGDQASGQAANGSSQPASGEGSSQEASGGDASGDGSKQMASGDQMQVDKSPSADTQAEGNAVTIGDLGKASDPAGNPTYDIAADGTADWYTWRGYKKYGANCLQCHGPDGMGSSFAPNLTDQLSNINYYQFAGILVSGQQNKWNPSGNSVMPAWGDDPNVMCSLDAIYIYLRSRTDGVVGRGEPKRPKQTELTKKAKQDEYDCLGF